MFGRGAPRDRGRRPWSDRLVDDFEGGLSLDGPAAHVGVARRIEHHAAPDRLALEQAQQLVLAERRRPVRQGGAERTRGWLMVIVASYEETSWRRRNKSLIS